MPGNAVTSVGFLWGSRGVADLWGFCGAETVANSGVRHEQLVRFSPNNLAWLKGECLRPRRTTATPGVRRWRSETGVAPFFSA
jgi:hypothetical protein